MKKVFNIFLACALLISTFDIIDTHDISIAGTPVFSSTNDCDSSDRDNLEQNTSTITLSGLVYHLQDASVKFDYPSQNKNDYFAKIIQPKFNKLIISLYRPPSI